MLSHRRPLLLAACLPILLQACVTSSKFVEPPAIPADLRECFDRLVAAPERGALTEKRVVRLIRDLRRSELEKAGCGDRVIALWDDYAAAARDRVK
jgi:hypothetical protein